MLRQGDCKFEASLLYTARYHFMKTKTENGVFSQLNHTPLSASTTIYLPICRQTGVWVFAASDYLNTATMDTLVKGFEYLFSVFLSIYLEYYYCWIIIRILTLKFLHFSVIFHRGKIILKFH